MLHRISLMPDAPQHRAIRWRTLALPAIVLGTMLLTATSACASEADLAIPDLHEGTFNLFGRTVTAWNILFYGALVICGTLGISLYPDHALVPTDLLKFADTAMYQAKAEGRNTYQIYNETMDAESRRRATVLASLRKALDRGEFRLVYQPRMALADGRITGVESLLRWHSAELGEIPPTVFIPLAEESGLILQIGDWVLSEALQTLKRWRSHGCVRVQRPTDLANYMAGTELLDSDFMTEPDSISHPPKWHKLKVRVPVFLLYLPADCDEKGNLIYFPDVYKREAPNA